VAGKPGKGNPAPPFSADFPVQEKQNRLEMTIVAAGKRSFFLPGPNSANVSLVSADRGKDNVFLPCAMNKNTLK
jgi:hypothetical protein